MLSIHPPHPNPPGWLKLFQVQKSHDVATRNMVIMGCGEVTGPGFQLKNFGGRTRLLLDENVMSSCPKIPFASTKEEG